MIFRPRPLLETTLHALLVIRLAALARGAPGSLVTSLIAAGEGRAALGRAGVRRGHASHTARALLGLRCLEYGVGSRSDGRRRCMHAGGRGHHQVKLARVSLRLSLSDAQYGAVRVSARERTHAPARVLLPITRLAVRVPIQPGRPTSLAVGGRDVSLQIEAIAMLEAHATFVNGLNARAAAADCCQSRKEQCRSCALHNPSLTRG